MKKMCYREVMICPKSNISKQLEIIIEKIQFLLIYPQMQLLNYRFRYVNNRLQVEGVY